MTTASAIVLADAQATPVNVTFDPIGFDDSRTFWFVGNDNTDVIGASRISLDIKQPGPPAANQTSKGRVYRIKIGLHRPVLETLGTSDAGYTPAPTVAYIPRCFIDFYLPEQSVGQNRLDIRKMAANLLDNSQIMSVVEDLIRLS